MSRLWARRRRSVWVVEIIVSPAVRKAACPCSAVDRIGVGSRSTPARSRSSMGVSCAARSSSTVVPASRLVYTSRYALSAAVSLSAPRTVIERSSYRPSPINESIVCDPAGTTLQPSFCKRRQRVVQQPVRHPGGRIPRVRTSVCEQLIMPGGDRHRRLKRFATENSM